MNGFYNNAAKSVAYGTQNLMHFNTLNKLYLVYYVDLVNNYFENQNAEQPIDNNYFINISNTISKVTGNCYNMYIQNFEIFEKLFKSKLLDINTISIKSSTYTIDEYVESLTADEKAIALEFCTFVIGV